MRDLFLHLQDGARVSLPRTRCSVRPRAQGGAEGGVHGGAQIGAQGIAQIGAQIVVRFNHAAMQCFY
jgi:hypothetical protein